MENKALQVFNNPAFGSVRTVVIDNEPWFVGKDVAECLGYGDTNQAIRKHVDDEDKLTRRFDGSGQGRDMTIINESGLYSLILSSKLPTAEEFKHWVTSEVLPDIRKHGLYATESVLDTMLRDPDYGIGLLKKYKEEKQAKERLQVELDQSKEWYTIKRVAQLNGISRKKISWRRLKRASEELGYNIKKIIDPNGREVNLYHVKAWEIAYPELEL